MSAAAFSFSTVTVSFPVMILIWRCRDATLMASTVVITIENTIHSPIKLMIAVLIL